MEFGDSMITLSIPPQVFWGLVTFVAFGIIVGLTLTMVGFLAPGNNWLVRLKKNLGLKDFSTGLFLSGALIWCVVFLLLVLGLIGQIWNVLWPSVPLSEDKIDEIWDWRFSLVKLAAVTATLGAVVVLPITLQQLRLTRQQTNLTAEALFNDKINAAANDLHARRLVTQNPGNGKNHWDYWQDDIVRRNAAIDRLEGLAIERPDVTPRIARLLGIYLRELSAEITARKALKGATLVELHKWAQTLSACRSDMQNAAQTLGRLQPIDGVDADEVKIDLRGANLQGFDLGRLSFENALFEGAQMQGANLIGTEMQGANLSRAKMQGADLSEADMQGADLGGAQMQRAVFSWAKMQGADLSGTEIQGADLRGAEMDSATSFSAAMLSGAALNEVDYRDISLSQAQVDDLFYDGSVTFAPDINRASGRDAVLGPLEFVKQWRAWRKQYGAF